VDKEYSILESYKNVSDMRFASYVAVSTPGKVLGLLGAEGGCIKHVRNVDNFTKRHGVTFRDIETLSKISIDFNAINNLVWMNKGSERSCRWNMKAEIFVVAPSILIILCSLFVQLMHTHYKIVKLLKSFKIMIVYVNRNMLE